MKISKSKSLLVLLMALVCSVAAWAEDLSMAVVDSIPVSMADSISAPEWYVAPLDYDSVMTFSRALRRAAAPSCPIDSIWNFNEDAVLSDVSIYEYGDTTRTITWAINSDGSRVGKSKQESFTSDTVTFSATYTWDNTTNNWKGTTKTVNIFNSAHKNISNTTFDWLNGAWSPKTRYTYTYDESNRQIEYINWTRDANNNLVPSKGTVYDYDEASRKTLDISYTKYSNGAWSAGTKRVYAYDVNGNQIEYAYYSSLSNDNWVGSSHEYWTYDLISKKKTYYQKQIWSNGDWKNSLKERWNFQKFTTTYKQSLYEKYSYNEDWVLTQIDSTSYDASGRDTLVENYTYTNGVANGAKKEKYEYYKATTYKVNTYKYKWTNEGTWINNSWSVQQRNDNGTIIETANYTWSEGAWKGSGVRTLYSTNISITGEQTDEEIKQNWAVSDWGNTTRKTTISQGGNTIQEASYTWDVDHWVGVDRKDWYYNAAGRNDTIKTYTNDGSNWIYSNRTVNTYNASGINIMTHNAKWENEAWVMTSMTKLDLVFDESNRQILNASWRCGADSVWVGVQKDTASYTLSGKTLYTAHYGSWANNNWIGTTMMEYQYDSIEYLLMQQRFVWNNNQWKGQDRYEYVYDSLGRQISTATYDGWNATTNEWIGNSKSDIIYNDLGQISASVISRWEGGWAFYQMYSYRYDENQREVEQILQIHTNGNWVNYQKQEKEYAGTDLVKNNTYQWIDNQWKYNSRNEYIYDADTSHKLRREITGSWYNGVKNYYYDNLYYYACDPRFFTIRFVDYDGTELSSQQVLQGQMPVYEGTEPTKDATAQYTYTFAGWNPAIIPVTAAATYTAEFDSTKVSYLITFKNGDQVLQSTQVNYGETPTYNGETPTKPSDDQYSYVFAGWDPEIALVTGAATYNATFTATTKTYTVTWRYPDGTEIDHESLEYGATPTHADAEKAATAEWTYTFTGWSPSIATVTGDATYTAQFDSVRNTYTVTWRNADGTEIDHETLEYGTTPAHADVIKENTAEWTYSFTGWTPEIVPVTGEVTYTAHIDSVRNSYTVTWLNADGTEIDHETLEYGVTPTHADVTKEKTAKYTYTFTGWSPSIVTVTGDATYTAQFDSVINTYTIIFYFEDGETILDELTVAYGEIPSTPLTPSSTHSDDQYTYTFAGWSPEIVPATSDASYTAVYTRVVNQYTVTFKNYNNQILQSLKFDYGSMPEYTGVTPYKPSTNKYTYEFTGWTPELDTVKANAAYTAVFASVLKTFTILFVDEDGVTVLDSVTVEYGQKPVYTGETPAKADDEQYTYTFAGWTPMIVAATADASYTATYTSKDKHEGLPMTNDQLPITNKVYRNGVIYILRGGKTYTLDGRMNDSSSW